MLDTSIASELIRNPAGRAAVRARAAGPAVCLSAIVAAELLYGCARVASPRLRQRVALLLAEMPVLPFEASAADTYGVIRAELEADGLPIGANDLLIAAHAQTLAATLVTANTRQFSRVKGLIVENWLT